MKKKSITSYQMMKFISIMYKQQLKDAMVEKNLQKNKIRKCKLRTILQKIIKKKIT